MHRAPLKERPGYPDSGLLSIKIKRVDAVSASQCDVTNSAIPKMPANHPINRKANEVGCMTDDIENVPHQPTSGRYVLSFVRIFNHRNLTAVLGDNKLFDKEHRG
jgi:hypothetical protein